MFYFYVKRRIYQKQKKLILRVEQEKERESYHAKIEFFTNIAHEIKTPLTLIKGPLEYIIHNKSFDVETKESLDTVMKNTERLLSLTYQLLDFRRIEAKQMRMKFEQIDVVLLSQTIYDRFKLPAEQQGIRFDISLPESPLSAEVDVEAFTKIISNLFTNALKYSSTYISMVLAKVDKEYFFISVENDGEVISQQMREKIFEPFVQVSSQGQVGSGRGLGLPLARSLAELHGGSLQLDITCTENNRFLLRLPYSHAIRNEKLNEEESLVTNDIDVEKVQQTVLIVEDNLEILEMLEDIFAPIYHVYKAINGKEGFEATRELHPDIVLSDVMMPEMSGKEMCHKIKNSLDVSHIPVVLLTAQTSVEYTVEGYMFGADDYVTKPFNIKVLVSRCNNLVRTRRMLLERFNHVSKTPVVSNAINEQDQELIDRATAIIRKYFEDIEFDMNVLAAELGIGRSKLYLRIKEITGLTPNELTLKIKLEEAMYLITNQPNLNVSEISYQLGFSSPRYFSKCFKSFYGVSPQNCRKGKNKSEESEED